MEKRELEKGDLVQIDPGSDPRFGGCIAVVDEPKEWGAQVFVAMPAAEGVQRAYYRVEWKAMEWVGRALWVEADDESGGE